MTTDVKQAKQLEALEKVLVKKFREAQKREQESRQKLIDANKVTVVTPDSLDHQTPLSQGLVSSVRSRDRQTPLAPPPPLPPQPSKVNKIDRDENLTVAKARALETLNKKLQNEFTEVHLQGIEEQREREKKYEAITKAIKEKKEQEAATEEKTKEWLRKQKYNQLMARRRLNSGPSMSSTPQGKFVGYMGVNADDDEEDKMETEEIDQNQSMKQLMDANVVNLGSIGTRYLPRANDAQFGIYYDETTHRLKIGNQNINFDYDDILMGDVKYKGTVGLWKLLTNKGFVKPEEYTGSDWSSYKDILLRSNSLYQKNDPASKRPKASQGQKWKKMIKPLWEEITRPTTAPVASTSTIPTLMVTDVEEMTGSGLKEYNTRPVEYKYIKNLNELVNRLNYIHAQEAAGNNSFHNEKLSVVKFIHDRMEELVDKPNGLKYLLRCLSALPERVIEGSGLLNDIINKLPFELHVPGYNFCGPGTRLEQRLGRGDKGINPLDEQCKQHDIWYRDHKKAEDRWVADKELQKTAWQRVISPDADLNERAVGLATAGTMWLKRKLGMGLDAGCSSERYSRSIGLGTSGVLSVRKQTAVCI